MLVAAGSDPRAQDAVVTVPPIPALERFIPRGELKATLRLSADRLVPGEVPVFWLVLENAGNTTIRVPRQVVLGRGVTRRVFTASGDEVHSPLDNICDYVVHPTSVRSLLVLAPRQSSVLRLEDGCGSHVPPLPVGEYRIRTTYANYPDWPSRYDVYEDGGSDAWDGEIETLPTTLSVVPFDADTERALIDAVESDADATEAIRLVGLGRIRGAVDGLLRRFARDASRRVAIVGALSYIGERSAADRLGAALELLPWIEQQRLTVGLYQYHQYLPMLVRDGRDCDGMGLLLALPSRAVAQTIERQCPDLRTRLGAVRDAPRPTDLTSVEGQRVANRASAADRLLSALEVPPATPVNVSQAQDVKLQPDATALSEYVATIRSGDGDDNALELAVSGVVRFGNASTFGQLRDAMESADEHRRFRTGRVLVDFTFQNAEGPIERSMTTLPFWERWWQQNGRRSREQWARDALARRDPLSESLAWTPESGKRRAAEYLVTNQRGHPSIVRELAAHRSWRVRLGSADALVAFDAYYAGRLMLRELQNRYVGACTAAGNELSRLTGRWHPFQCNDVAGRERVTALWTRDVDLLPRGPLSTGQ